MEAMEQFIIYADFYGENIDSILSLLITKNIIFLTGPCFADMSISPYALVNVLLTLYILNKGNKLITTSFSITKFY